MIRYKCINIDEINYIIGKYDYTYSKEEMDDILYKLDIKKYIYLIKNPEYSSTYCAGECNMCMFVKICYVYTLNITSVSNIMREEKLKRILE
jgi:hypothetical protein